MTSTLEKILNVSESSQHIITLYDTNQKKEIIRIGKIKEASWIDKLFLDSSFSFKKIFATTKLNSLNGVLLTVTEPDQAIINNLWHNQILVMLYVLVFSILLYFFIRNLFNKYYSLHGAMKQAIRSGQFYPVYQPLFDTKNNVYSGAEVLLRWQDNQDEIIMPDLFIEEAENTGLIVPITLQIIETAFKEAKNILRTKPTFYLSFNICALHFTDDNFFPQFYKLVRHYSISRRQILLEVTERYLLDMNNEIYIERMQELRDAGYSLAIDDYGTGHSSISYLQYYPFNYLKIDKIFIHAIGTKAITETLNDAIIHLAKKINLAIIAEGVETKEQLDYLLQNEVQFLQGWYFSKALHIEQLIELLKGKKMNKYIGYCSLLVLGISFSSFAQPLVNLEGNYWQCSTGDITHTKWDAQSAYQKMALNLSYAACKKGSKAPATCKVSKASCIKFVNGVNVMPMWRCTAFDREALRWRSNLYPNREDAALAALAYCKHKSPVPYTCSINVVTCINKNEI